MQFPAGILFGVGRALTGQRQDACQRDPDGRTELDLLKHVLVREIVDMALAHVEPVGGLRDLEQKGRNRCCILTIPSGHSSISLVLSEPKMLRAHADVR